MTPQYDLEQVNNMSSLKHMENTNDKSRFTFLGRAYDLDVYKNNWRKESYRVVGPDSRTHDRTRCAGVPADLMWTTFEHYPSTGNIDFRDNDVHVGVHHLVEIYGLVARYMEHIT